MTNRALLLTILVLACLGSGFAQSDIVYVSYNGLDTHPCTRTSSCQTITHALSVVNAGGQVNIIGSGTYDNFTITKSATVAAEPGVIAVLDVTGFANSGITINAGANDRVVIRGLYLNGGGPASGTNGIYVRAAGEVSLEDVVARNFDSAALSVASSVASFISVKGGVYAIAPLSANFQSGIYPVAIFFCCTGQNPEVPPVATVDGVTVENGCTGVNPDGLVVTITNSLLVASPNSNANCAQQLGGSIGISQPGVGTVVIENNLISNYGFGISGGDDLSANFYLSGNTIVGNAVGVNNSGFFGPANVFTRANNTIAGNGQNVTGTITAFNGQ
jgi:hypothetical protein